MLIPTRPPVGPRRGESPRTVHGISFAAKAQADACTDYLTKARIPVHCRQQQPHRRQPWLVTVITDDDPVGTLLRHVASSLGGIYHSDFPAVCSSSGRSVS